MKKLIYVISLLCGLNLLLAGCDRGGQSGMQTTPSPTTTEDQLMSDSDLEKAVRAKLDNDAQLKEADLSVIAIADRNEVTLSGTVRSHAARERAIELARSAKSGILVNDQIDVKPAA